MDGERARELVDPRRDEEPRARGDGVIDGLLQRVGVPVDRGVARADGPEVARAHRGEAEEERLPRGDDGAVLVADLELVEAVSVGLGAPLRVELDHVAPRPTPRDRLVDRLQSGAGVVVPGR